MIAVSGAVRSLSIVGYTPGVVITRVFSPSAAMVKSPR
jgi:hypothetical protein